MTVNASVPSPFECVLDARASLGEGPVWSPAEQVLYWIDINAPSLNRFDPRTARNDVMPLPESIGCIAMRRSGGFVAALRSGIWLVHADGRLDRRIADPPYDPSTHRFNDGRCDRQGRFWAGSMNEQRNGATATLERLDPGYRLTRVLDAMTISNGLSWSPDGRTMYHADTTAQRVRAYDFDPQSGSVSNGRTFVQFSAPGDRPDGAAVDSAGCYWVALYRGAALARFSPRGEPLERYPLPVCCPTMPAFGGPDLRTVYVTTARQKLSTDELAQWPLAGGVFAMHVDTPGLPEPCFAG
jgi:sugar lactone lactonase YvrE